VEKTVSKLSRKLITLIASLSVMLAEIVSANAGIITEKWSAEVYDSKNNSFSIGDLVTWELTYDNQGTVAYVKSDGADGLIGTADDYIYDTYDASCPSGVFCNRYSVYTNLISSSFANVVAQLKNDVAALTSQSDSIEFVNRNSRSNNWTYTNGEQRYADWEIDDAYMAMGYYHATSSSAMAYYYSLNGVQTVSNIALSNLTLTSVTEVPESGSIVIFIIGFMLLLSRQLITRKKRC